MKRFEFVKGWVTGGTDPADGSVECGDGTHYPLEATLDQIAEIYYRARDSYLTGSITTTYTSSSAPELLAITTTGFTGTPSTDLVESGVTSEGETTLSQRAYSTGDVAGFAQYFGSAYSVNGQDFYDANSELAIYSLPFNSYNSRSGLTQNFFTTFSEDAVRFHPITMPSFYSAYHEIYRNDTTAPQSGIYIYEAISSSTGAFSSSGGVQIAWIDDNESGNPLDPLNRKFINFHFALRQNFIYGGAEPSYSTFQSYDTSNTLVNFNVELSTSTLSCPLYAGNRGYAAFDGITHSGGINLVVTKWWPYAKDSPAVPVWDADTGLKL
jgi:hypothetical protein